MAKEVDYHTETINGHTFRMRYLPGGIFSMGDSQNRSFGGESTPAHKVELSPYYIGEYLVTQGLWKAVMGKDHNPSRFIGDKRPVENASWIDIVLGNHKGNRTPSFIDKINELTKKNRPKDFIYSLPTEAQWEYAARAKSRCFYGESDELKGRGWYDQNSHNETKDVGLLEANYFGLFDMCGNLWEWCLDRGSDEFYKNCANQGVVIDPVNLKKGKNRIVRGGSWFEPTNQCSVSVRRSWFISDRLDFIGFRLALNPI